MSTPRLSPLTWLSKQSFASIRPPTAVLPRNDNAIMDFPARTCDQPIVLLAITAIDPLQAVTNGSFRAAHCHLDHVLSSVSKVASHECPFQFRFAPFAIAICFIIESVTCFSSGTRVLKATSIFPASNVCAQ